MRKMSAKGLALIEQWAGSSNTVYRDSAGYPTIGVGHLLKKDELSSGKICLSDKVIKIHDPISEEDILSILSSDIMLAAECVDKAVKVQLTQDQFDALVSFTFNVGIGAFKGSTLLKVLNNGYIENVPKELARWNRAGGKVVPGLVNRRNNEIKLFGFI